MLKEQFPEINLFEIIESNRSRHVIVDNFQNTPKSAIILASLKAGDVGLL